MLLVHNRHYAQFTVMSGSDMFFGVIRPGWDVENGVGAHREDGHCFYDTYDGRRFPAPSDWEGKQAAKEQGDRIGMLLDLDQGSMTVWKDGQQMGVMVADWLTGPLCWAAVVAEPGDSARIESAPIPAPAAEAP